MSEASLAEHRVEGVTVRYRGDDTDDQNNWGGCSKPAGKLVPGQEYTVRSVKVHSWHTKVELEGVEGRFNSVIFDIVKEDQDLC